MHINMQLGKPMFCDNADVQGKECGEICLEIWRFAIQVQQLTTLKYTKTNEFAFNTLTRSVAIKGN